MNADSELLLQETINFFYDQSMLASAEAKLAADRYDYAEFRRACRRFEYYTRRHAYEVEKYFKL